MSDSVRLAIDHNCPCGRPYALISEIQGRQQEALTFATTDGPPRTVQPLVFHHVMDGVNTAGWQIRQRGDQLDVLLAQPHDLDTTTLAASIRAALAAQGVQPPRVAVRTVSSSRERHSARLRSS